MDTLNNLANAAAQAVNQIWPSESGQEPVSGVQGDTAKGEPYDAGNKEEYGAAGTTSGSSTSAGGSARGFSSGNANAVGDHGGPGSPGSLSGEQRPPSYSASGGGAAPGASASLPSRVPATAASGNRELPATHSSSGPGRPDGPSGVSSSTLPGGPADLSGDPSATRKPPATASSSSSSASHPNPDSAATASDKGTGEKLVRSSGLKADGGDFDAANPGAGREAERLLEEKGLRPGPHSKGQATAGAAGTQEHGKGGSSSSRGSKGLGQKIKEKVGHA